VDLFGLGFCLVFGHGFFIPFYSPEGLRVEHGFPLHPVMQQDVKQQ